MSDNRHMSVAMQRLVDFIFYSGDYRALNSRYPIRHIHDYSHQLSGCMRGQGRF
jgi:hypothetical protein